VGPRTLGLSAALGAVAGNEALYLNPGAIASRKRYSVEAGGVVDRRGSDTVDQFLGGSVVDSMTSALAAGFSYQRATEGAYEGNVFHLALAGPIAQGFFFGLGGKWLNVDGQEGRPSSSAGTADAGILWQVSSLVTVGAAGYNLVPISNDELAPMGVGAGIAIGSDQKFQVTGDWRADFDRRQETTNRYAAGVEVLLGRLVPVRAGWTRDETLDTSWWSVGAGLVSQGGIAFDVGYRQSLDSKSARTLAASLKVFLFQ
jgi:hypothetical protein